MQKFKAKESNDGHHNWYIGRGTCDFMHRDGEIVPEAVEYWPTEEQAQTVLDKHRLKSKNSLIGKTVVVFDRYHFALPLKGRIQDVSKKDGAYKVSFFSKQHGYPNYLKMDHTYFFSEQCQVVENDSDSQPPYIWKHGDVFKYSSGAVMICIQLKHTTSVYCLHPGSLGPHKNYHPDRAGDLSYLHEKVELLFNIKDKLGNF